MDPKAQPRVYRPLKGKVENELDHLEKEGVIEKIQSSNWAAPTVPVVKQDDSVRICGDYKLTINQAAKTESYPLPRIEDIFTSLCGRSHSQNWTWHMPTIRLNSTNTSSNWL